MVKELCQEIIRHIRRVMYAAKVNLFSIHIVPMPLTSNLWVIVTAEIFDEDGLDLTYPPLSTSFQPLTFDEMFDESIVVRKLYDALCKFIQRNNLTMIIEKTSSTIDLILQENENEEI